ncbi:alpha/beta fold hydrolase [Rhodothermus marinus]|uniref:alpha/beta fold hydrolase n=1 Tax=Rhodothermus marinus TaxID=29549 RepID=UPI0012BA4F59|nr:alpha/beta fold hydrolase [Rhodothermus marinus]BBM68552.1 alpha/beta hydrolase [Rhodothermus marinus]BBM71520.1 alpha/beta hydrolase [Rhodothermus marinus]
MPAPFRSHTEPYAYLEAGPASASPPVVLLYGMLGEPSNWEATAEALAANGYRVWIPLLPIYELPVRESNLQGLVAFLEQFLDAMRCERVVLAGNSLGGHLALLYALRHPERVAALVLTGASGIYEVELGTSTLRRYDRAYIRERAALTFYDPRHATDELVDRVQATIHDRQKAIRLIRMARSAQRETVTDRLCELTMPVLLIWGRNDRITPPEVAETFRKHLPAATLHFIDRCGHAPMIERPEQFNALLLAFLQQHCPTVVSNGRPRSAKADTSAPAPSAPTPDS